MKKALTILQPIVPHYREEFFKGLLEKFDLEIYCFEKNNFYKKESFLHSTVPVKQISNFKVGPFLLYNPFFLLKENKEVVLMLHVGHITTWLLLYTKFFHKKNINLWGHGISVKRYLKEEKKPSRLLKLMIKKADTIWFYTEKEKSLWENIFPSKKNMISLNNTLSNIQKNLESDSDMTRAKLKETYNIKESICYIFSARFNMPERRADILEKIIADSNRSCAFIIIGDGFYKPDFNEYTNVYDFGKLYDDKVKNELFKIADAYIQPAWLGLSVVEAMSYGLPILTLRRTEEIKQCVEYFYLEESGAGKIFENLEEFQQAINNMEKGKLEEYSKRAKAYVANKLQMKNMVDNAVKSINNTINN